MIKVSAWLHWMLTFYLWLIEWIPLGNWNYEKDGQLLPSVIAGNGIQPADIGMLVFVTLPAVLFWTGYKRRNVWFLVSGLIFDLAWLTMQILSWWLPYIAGTKKVWQLEYAKGRTTKLLPSFGSHIAPDAMHSVIHVLLVLAIITGFTGVIKRKVLWQAR